MTIAQYLSEVPNSTESPREIVGQLLDTTAQILELETEYFMGSKPLSNSLGDLQELLNSLQQKELGSRLKYLRQILEHAIDMMLEVEDKAIVIVIVCLTWFLFWH